MTSLVLYFKGYFVENKQGIDYQHFLLFFCFISLVLTAIYWAFFFTVTLAIYLIHFHHLKLGTRLKEDFIFFLNLVAEMMKKVLEKGVDESVAPERGTYHV